MPDDGRGPSPLGAPEWRAGLEAPVRHEVLGPAPNGAAHASGPRRWLPAVAAAAAVVLFAGALGLIDAAQGASGGGSVSPPVGLTAAPTPTGWTTRTVRFAGVSLTVPALWDERPDPDPRGWCLATGLPLQTPYVSNGLTDRAGAHCPVGRTDAPPGFPAVPETLWVTHLSLTRLADEPASVRDGTQTYDGWTLTTRTVGDVVVRLLTDADHVDAVGPVMGSVQADRGR